jgi:hypothetical protein
MNSNYLYPGSDLEGGARESADPKVGLKMSEIKRRRSTTQTLKSQYYSARIAALRRAGRSRSEIATETGWTKGAVQRAFYGQMYCPDLPKNT